MLILDVSSKDKKILLGLKQIKEDPWKNINDYFKVTDKIAGKVLYVLDKGIIFLLDNDFEGILPISKIDEGSKYLFEINKEIDLVVSQINKDNRKIVLNLQDQPTDFLEDIVVQEGDDNTISEDATESSENISDSSKDNNNIPENNTD